MLPFTLQNWGTTPNTSADTFTVWFINRFLIACKCALQSPASNTLQWGLLTAAMKNVLHVDGFLAVKQHENEKRNRPLVPNKPNQHYRKHAAMSNLVSINQSVCQTYNWTARVVQETYSKMSWFPITMFQSIHPPPKEQLLNSVTSSPCKYMTVTLQSSFKPQQPQQPCTHAKLMHNPDVFVDEISSYAHVLWKL